MGQYPTLDHQDIQHIAARYDLENVYSQELLGGGSENTNYLITTEKGKYVLTICEQKSFQEAAKLANLLEHLEKYDFSTSKIVRTAKNEAIIPWNNKPILLKVFLPGKIVTDLPINLIMLLGASLGRLHQLNVPEYLPRTLSYGLERFDEVKAYVSNLSFYNWLTEVREMLQVHISPELPKALIHSDIFYSNVIVSEDESSVTIMDFEEAAYYYRVFDIGMTIVGVCREGNAINLQKVHGLLQGYQTEIQLLDLELNALQAFTVYAAAAMSFWRHKNFNYTKPDPELKDHYLELKKIADHVKGLPGGSFYLQ